MKLTRPDLSAYAVVGMCVVAITVLIALGKTPPDFLQYIALTALGVGGGVALQGSGGPTSTTSEQPAAQPVAPLPLAALPVPLTSEPATGVFRAATHAP